MLKNLFSLGLFLVISVTAFAGLEEDYQAIKDSGRSFEPQGTICEEVAKLNFEKQYPAPQYSVITGIAYSDKTGTLGELDIIVLDATNTAVLYGEVKCWKNPKEGLAKAFDQKNRFFKNIRSSKELKFQWDFDPTKVFTKEQFNKTEKFVTIAQKGSKEAGFDQELEYTLRELMQLRARILRCQDLEGCKKPTY